MDNSPILTNYSSEIDQLLQNFDKENPVLSNSQRKEHNKYQYISFLRDNPNRPDKSLPIWEGF